MSKTTQRIHGFDALRTIAMWLGIVLHALTAYKTTPVPPWPHDDRWNLGFYEWLYDIVHLFRMPLFFFVAGFFARLVIQRSGLRYFADQRFKRIVVPFVASCLVLLPITMVPFNFYTLYDRQHLPLAVAWRSVFAHMVSWNGLAHLWFLYYLILFYIVSCAASYLIDGIRARTGRGVRWTFASISPLALLLTCGVLFLLLRVFRHDVPPTYTGLRPELFNFLYYGFFYGCGWIVQTNMDAVNSLKKGDLLMVLVGLGISIWRWLGAGRVSVVADLAAAAVETVALTAGLTGLFLRYFREESKLWRYCSDSAYWVYLVHLGLVAGLQAFLLNSAIWPWLQLPLILVIAVGISLLSYEYLVRYTLIGVFLHGKRMRPGAKKGSIENRSNVSGENHTTNRPKQNFSPKKV